jgi:hypothetical protein
MEDHGTVFESRFKLMRERVEAMKEIWTKSKASARVQHETDQYGSPSSRQDRSLS